MVSGSLTPNLVDLWWTLTALLYQINLKNYWIFKFFYVISEEGNGFFQQATVRAVIKKHDIKYGWLTPAAKSSYVGPNKRQNYWISTVFSEEGGLNFSRIFRKTPLGNDVKKKLTPNLVDLRWQESSEILYQLGTK